MPGHGHDEVVKQDRERLYRKGWQRIVDAETPAVPDLIFGTEMDTANLPSPRL